MGLLKDPQKIKMGRPEIDIDRNDAAGATRRVHGASHWSEVRHRVLQPGDRKDHMMYTCKLDGCKSAWGTSDDMYRVSQKKRSLVFKGL